MLRTRSYALIWPSGVSEVDSAPSISVRASRAPTRRYWASTRCSGSAMNDGEIRLTDVESPRWITDVHGVRGGPGTVMGGTVVGGTAVGSTVVGGVVGARVAGTVVCGGAVTSGGSPPS